MYSVYHEDECLRILNCSQFIFTTLTRGSLVTFVQKVILWSYLADRQLLPRRLVGSVRTTLDGVPGDLHWQI